MKDVSRQKIAWFLPDFNEGSGGIRTVLQNACYLVKSGYICDLYIVDSKKTEEQYKRLITDCYGLNFNHNIYCGDSLNGKYDAAIATFFKTAGVVAALDVPHKLYFVQDYEPFFFPTSENSIEAERSYCLGLSPITIGKWLSNKVRNEEDSVPFFSFCADLNTYKKLEDTTKEDAICFVCQPDKPRRCTELGLKALQIIKKKRPDIKVYLFGSPKTNVINLKAKHLGLLPVEECNSLYNKCKVGICLSATNPSRIPFEMMAAGLPVVDLYLENNLYDEVDEGCLLAMPDANSIAEAALKIIEDKTLYNTLSSDGYNYMKNYPLERGYKEFKEALDMIILGGKTHLDSAVRKKQYNKKPYSAEKKSIISEPSVRLLSNIEKKNNKRIERDQQRKNTFWGKVVLKIRYLIRGY